MRRWAIVNALLGVIVVLLAIQIAGTWGRTLPRPEERSRQPPPPPAEPREKGRRASERAPASPDVLVAAITEKDLFDPSRRPPPEDGSAASAVQEAAPVPPPSGVAVVGIRLLHGEREAFIQDATQQNKQRRLRVGDQLQSFTVKEITDTQVVLAGPSGQSLTMDVELKKSGGARGAAPSVTPRGSATTITIPRPTTTSTTRPPRGTIRLPGPAATGVPTLNRAVEQKLHEIRKRGAGGAVPAPRAEPLSAAGAGSQGTRRTS